MKRWLSAALLAFVFVSTANSQTFRGAINGTVMDPSNAVVPGAQVKATNSATGLEYSTVTSSDGQFAFQDLPLGDYKISVSATGFPQVTVAKVDVTAGTIH